MAVLCDDYNHVGVLAVEGDLTAENASLLRRNVEERIASKQIADFVVDLEHCGFMDSEGLEALLWLKRRCEELFGQVKLVALDDNCKKILEVTRLGNRFECQPDLAGALKNMR